MTAYVLIMIVQIAGATQASQQVVGEFPSIEKCRQAAKNSELVGPANDRNGSRPRIDFVCVERSKL